MPSKYLVYAAKFLSVLFAPFYFPTLAFLILLVFSFMRMLPLDYKLFILAIVYSFTVAIPLVTIYVWQRVQKRPQTKVGNRKARTVPYLIFIICYTTCLYVMIQMNMPHFMISILAGASILQVVCVIINHWIHISTHSAAAGAMVGALLAFSIIFQFGPTWWLCLALLIAGCVGNSRLILRRHGLLEVNLGLGVGLLCGFFCILLL